MDSFLSEGVRHQIIELPKKHSHLNDLQTLHSKHGCVIDDDFTFNWSFIKQNLEISENWNSSFDRCFPFYLDTYFHLNRISTSDFDKLINLCKWTRRENELRVMYLDFQKATNSNCLQGIAYLTSVFEKALGDVYLLKGRNVPFLLRDLLATKEIISIFGEIQVYFVKVLIGTPKSLNLRNLVWHGFPLNRELHFCYVSTLFLIIASFGKIISIYETIPNRPSHDLVNFTSQLFKNYEFLDLRDRIEEVKQSFKICNLEFHTEMMDYYKESKNGQFLILILPFFENFMRQKFCEVNKTAERLKTAESDCLYTTLDEIFERNLENGEENLIYLSYNPKILNCYEDLFSYQAGPRIRDKLSHGEVLISDIPNEFCNIILNLILGFIDPEKWTGLNSYKVLYHPNAILKNKSLELAQENELKVELQILNVNQNYSELTKNVIGIFEKFKTESFFKEIEVPTNEISSTISLLTRIIENCLKVRLTFSQKLKSKFTSFLDRKLRSRQRESFLQMVSNVNYVFELLRSYNLIVMFYSAAAFLDYDIQESTKYFKKVLKSVELMESEIVLEKNRWSLIKVLTDSVLQTTIERTTQPHFQVIRNFLFSRMNNLK